MEGVEWGYESGILKAKDIDEMQKEMKTARLNKLEETKLNLWKRFVENLSLHVIADPAESRILVMPTDKDLSFTNEKVKEALDILYF